MSQSTKRKHVTKELLDDNFELPKENQKIVRIVAGRGNNLHQVIEADEKTTYLVSMPNKFRKNVWVKRGNYCIVEPIEEGDKVKAEIVRILYKVCMYLRFVLIINNMVQILRYKSCILKMFILTRNQMILKVIALSNLFTTSEPPIYSNSNCPIVQKNLF